MFLLNGEGWQNGTPFTFILWVSVLFMIVIIQKKKEKARIQKKNNSISQ